MELSNENKVYQSEPKVLTIRGLPFNKFTIPPYQRPYKWTGRNVNQLISDIITFRNKNQYRLGTLVLYNNEIVDGQQRIVTLVLLLSRMFECLNDSKIKGSYNDIINKIHNFAGRIKFRNRYSLHNVVENVHAIDNRKIDFDHELLDFVLSKCEFVVIELNNISEAFQFFDSQNARGKDLEAHDLLKAYHLREITTLSDSDALNIDEWQNQPTEQLKNLFLTLFRAKQWSQGKGARYFSKNHTNIFKGVSLNGGKRYPFYQMEIIAHIFSDIYNRDATRIIDGKHMEYPFNLDDQIINGSRFFDMIRHYMQLYHTITSYKTTLKDGVAKTILGLIHQYNGVGRTGDRYVREMFYTLLLYYVDRFGEEELDKVVPQFFIWAYRIRLQNTAVRLATIDNYATNWDSMFRCVHEAQSPYDVINTYIDGINDKKCSGCEQIIEKFKDLNKYHGND